MANSKENTMKADSKNPFSLIINIPPFSRRSPDKHVVERLGQFVDVLDLKSKDLYFSKPVKLEF